MTARTPLPSRAAIPAGRWLAVWLALAAWGCGAPPPEAPKSDRPLWSAAGAATLERLVEAARLEEPPATGPNRFLTGWWPRRAESGRRLAPAGTARLEITLLEARAGRSLWIDLAAGPAASAPLPPVRYRIGVAGRPAEAEWTDPLVVPLPGDLEGERIPIDLDFPPGVDIEVLGAVLRGGLGEGGLLPSEGALTQSGPSVAEWIDDAQPGASLVGRFTPPRRPAEDQRFALRWIDADGVETEAFAWRPDWRSRWGLGGARPVDFDVPVSRAAAGPLRLRFVARGAGESGSWSHLGWREAGGAPAGTAVPPAPGAVAEEAAADRAAQRPRIVLFFVFDALRADFLGSQGGPSGVSPTLDRLAGEGVAFLEHRSVAPNTLPSTKALFTGEVPRVAGGAKLADTGPPTLAERFRQAGYRTACFSGNPNVSSAFGTTRGFDFAPEETLHPGRLSRDAPFNNNARVVYDAARRWIDRLPKGESAFVYLHTIHPHNPYAPPADLARAFTRGIDSRIDGSTRTLLDLSLRRREPGPRDVERLRGLYAGSVAYNDRELDRLLRAISRRVPAEDLLVVVTSDHGEELGEHGGFLHGYSLYEEMLRIPLVVWSPRRFAPRRVTAPTDTLDVHSTMIDLIEPGAMATAGRSLLPVMANGVMPAEQPFFAAGSSLKGGVFAARDGRHKLVLAPRSGDQWGMGNGVGRRRDSEFVFDLDADPRERRNRAGDPPPVELRRLRQSLRSWVLAGTGSPDARAAANPDEAQVDAETRARLQALGYLQ